MYSSLQKSQTMMGEHHASTIACIHLHHKCDQRDLHKRSTIQMGCNLGSYCSVTHRYTLSFISL